MKSTVKVLALVLCAVMILCALAGCGSSSKEQKAEKSIIRLSLEGDPEHLDESITNYTTVWWSSSPVNDHLLDFDQNMDIQPAVLESYSMADDLSFLRDISTRLWVLILQTAWAASSPLNSWMITPVSSISRSPMHLF